MAILEKIRQIFGRQSVIPSARLQRLRSLSKDQARRELGVLLYDHCVQRAACFVKGELKRGDDSPYRGLAAEVFYHEILAVTFWLLNKNSVVGNFSLLDELHRNYLAPLPSPGERQEQLDRLGRKYKRYEATWNDVTGHLDQFGLCVVQNIYGPEESILARERTFWIIEYADEANSSFSGMKTVWKKFDSHL